MSERIAMGFHTCVDYELVWDTEVVEEQIKAFDIRADELRMDIEVDSERAIWIVCLAHFKEGIGGEAVPLEPEDCERFASHFEYKVTLGGTATRAAIILDGLGYETMLQTSCYNEHVKRLMPKSVRTLPGVDEEHNKVYPHIVLQCRGGVRIRGNDIDFVTPRENRIMVSRDFDSLNIPILPEKFGKMITDVDVFLLGCFSEVIDKEVLKGCMEKTRALLSHLKKDAVVVLEDGCYVRKEFRYYVHEQLASVIDVLSMNEDELQDYIGRRINILDPQAVKEVLENVRESTGVKTMIVHSAAWALAYGENASGMREALEGGSIAAATRFRMGDGFKVEDYEATKKIKDKAEGIRFCEELERMLGNKVCCIPSKDLSFVEHPTVVGLGDTFAGGLLTGLLH